MECFKEFLHDSMGVPEKDVDFWAAKLSVRTVAKNEFILQPGQHCSCTYFIERGVLRMYNLDKRGREHIVQFAPEKRLVSDRRSTYLNTPSVYFIQAVENSEIVAFPKGMMTEIVMTYPESVERNIYLLNTLIANLQDRVVMLIGATAEDRYLDFLCKYSDYVNRTPLWMIASYLGITPESLSRVRKILLTQ
ncbi:MAG: Crp/Fnr family transcriptional regulator [Prevotellaceae bacterium]|jgi:CRP-like cAMP-binding protein|nr:Crp/Fnr family transcriptional regulator [Prevotellaceae bacterium]